MMRRKKTNHRWTLCAGMGLALAGCDTAPRQDPEPVEPDTEEPRSIFEGEAPGAQVDLSPLTARIPFPDGEELSEQALAELATILDSPQVQRGGEIVLRGHTDSEGTDEANLEASRERAEAVRDWMVENGVDEERITVIAFGEQNPIEPNALANGEPNVQGRQANRRVDVTVALDPSVVQQLEKPTLVETLASPGAQETDEPEDPGS